MTLFFVPLSDDVLYSGKLTRDQIVPYHVDRRRIPEPNRQPKASSKAATRRTAKGADVSFPDWLGSVGRINGS